MCTDFSSWAHGLSCSMTRGIFPEQGLNLCPLHWQVDSYPLHCQVSPGSPFHTDYLMANIILMMMMIIIAATLIITVNTCGSVYGDFFLLSQLGRGVLLASSE